MRSLLKTVPDAAKSSYFMKNEAERAMKRIQRFSVPLLLLVLSGCIAPEMSRVSSTLAAPEYVNTPVAATQIAPLMPEAESYRQINHKKLFTLALNNVEIKDALAILSDESPIPIVPEPGVSGFVTVNIKDKPLGDLLFIMLRPLGYTAKIEEGMLVVRQSRLTTRTFVVNYLKDKRTSKSVTNASISAGNASGGNASQGNVSVTTSMDIDFWSETIKSVETIVYGTDKKDGGTSGASVVSNQLAGVLYVAAPAETMAAVSSFLDSVEKEVKRQVLIQAHIAEIDLNDRFSLGIDWKVFLDSAHKRSIAQNVLPTPRSNVFVIDINTSDFNLLLDAFKEQGDVKMLSSPKISTLNNQKAVIKLTTKEVTWVNSVLRDQYGNVTETINVPQIDEVGLFLDVTPNVGESGNIVMQVHPSITEVKEVSISPDKSSSKPVITVREVDTVIDVKSGQTMVIGGLISDKIITTKGGIPLLGDIPYLGWLFSNYSQEKRKTELVIFLTPYILDSVVIEDIRKVHENRLWGAEKINRFVDKVLK
ncbi:MAG: hypothetical protein CVU69_04875 [Deltaproteobacteria bacterium HGW-Deltaproteobacteria-4]|nr:MAG: hypothetical protein CVU69_04875 [Deltaproteobacteria bacterium HGW-Deltaproteobacteria-4]